jgi:hypothetical protein
MRGGELYDRKVIEIPAGGKRRSEVNDRTSGEKRYE